MGTMHTPGPWAVVYGYDGSIEVCSARPVRINLTTAGSVVVADICKHEDAEHFSAEANARLIAAAPELLEALVAAEAALNKIRVCCHHTAWDATGPAVITARAAIAKAKGDQQ